MTERVFLPSIHNNAPVTGQGELMTPHAAEFARLWMLELGERAKSMRVDERLVAAAQNHAIYLDSRTEAEIAERANVPHASHYGRDWSTPNERVRRVGYALPGNYPVQGNMVESNARDGNGPQAALEGLLHSDAHRPHLLGIDGFSDRTVYGIGNCGADWVVVICPPEG